MESDDGVLVITAIHAKYRLRVEPDIDMDAVERAFEAHAPKCPVYRTLAGCIDITTELVIE